VTCWVCPVLCHSACLLTACLSVQRCLLIIPHSVPDGLRALGCHGSRPSLLIVCLHGLAAEHPILTYHTCCRCTHLLLWVPFMTFTFPYAGRTCSSGHAQASWKEALAESICCITCGGTAPDCVSRICGCLWDRLQTLSSRPFPGLCSYHSSPDLEKEEPCSILHYFSCSSVLPACTLPTIASLLLPFCHSSIPTHSLFTPLGHGLFTRTALTLGRIPPLCHAFQWLRLFLFLCSSLGSCISLRTLMLQYAFPAAVLLYAYCYRHRLHCHP